MRIYVHAHADSNVISHPYSHAYSHSHADTNSHSDTYSHSNSDSDSNAWKLCRHVHCSGLSPV